MHPISTFFFNLLYSSNGQAIGTIDTPLTVAILLGSGYGLYRLVMDIGDSLWGKRESE